jgi:deoxyxylulose-5-phosphate synthase
MKWPAGQSTPAFLCRLYLTLIYAILDLLSGQTWKTRSTMVHLSQIKTPADIKLCSNKELSDLAEEIRQEIVMTVARNGGHLASNLGVVELTLAVHRMFNAPEDKILFDVGHQCYVHKLLTGRYAAFSTLRRSGGCDPASDAF